MPHGLDVLSQIVGLIIQCSTLITVIYAFVRFTQKPTIDLDTRVSTLERWCEKVDAENLPARTKQLEKDDEDTKNRLEQGNIHFKVNDESNRVTQSALLTIMDILGAMEGVPDSLKPEISNRRKELYDYLTDK